jgi:N-acetylglucosamine-6-phosphate deacetylase
MYFDLQVNGYGGVDFNQSDLNAEQLHAACEKLKEDQVSGILATFITESVDEMDRRLRRIVELREQDPLARELIVGLHIEGPFINEQDGYRGAHPLDAVKRADLDIMKQLLDAGSGLTRIVTLAPERDDGLRVTRFLADEGIVVSAGHCDPSMDELQGAVDAGLSMFTHLGNGAPMMMHRHDNIIQRALSLSDRIWLGLIADGTHLPYFTFANILKLAGIERCFVVSDAIAPAGLGPGRYSISRWDLVIGEDLVARAPDGSHFVGSAISMTKSADNLRHEVGLSENEIRELTLTNPMQAIGWSNS